MILRLVAKKAGATEKKVNLKFYVFFFFWNEPIHILTELYSFVS